MVRRAKEIQEHRKFEYLFWKMAYAEHLRDHHKMVYSDIGKVLGVTKTTVGIYLSKMKKKREHYELRLQRDRDSCGYDRRSDRRDK